MKQLFFQDIYFEYKTENTSRDQHFNHMHNEWELYFFISGDIDYILGRSSYHLKKNDLLLIRPNVYHYAIRNTDKPYKRFVINFSNEIAEKFFSNHETPFCIFSIPENDYINSVFSFLKDLPSTYSMEDLHRILHHSLETILLLLRYQSTDTLPVLVASPPHTFQEVLDYIDNNITAPFTIKSLAEQFFVSESWIIHSFRKYLNISAKQYINNKKVLYAQSLIQSGISATEAAYRCNFENYSTFYRLYKKYLDGTPRNERKNT